MSEAAVTVRVTLLAPPAGVLYSLQEGDERIVGQVRSTGADLTFEIPFRIGEGPDGPRWLGPYVRREGPRRFAYFRVGTLAGDHESPWTRRGKIWLTDIPAELVREAVASGRALAASFPGAGKDGTPSCASLKPVGGWVLG